MNKKYKPNASRPLLFLTAGLLWTFVGLWLCYLAIRWLRVSGVEHWYLYTFSGVLLAVAAYLFGFSRIAKKNILRLQNLPDKSCFFAFQAWKSYLIIVFMITLGVALRHSSIPRQWLAVVYMTIGGALVGASFHYYSQSKPASVSGPTAPDSNGNNEQDLL
jgi:FtsH-binding integral membrane protein